MGGNQGMNASTLEYWLGRWAAWMKADRHNLGYPGRSAVVSSGGASEAFEDLCERADLKSIKATDAAVRSLTLQQQAAVYHVYLGAVFRLRDDPQSVYEACLPALEVEARKRGVF
jgi:hypothetical protein